LQVSKLEVRTYHHEPSMALAMSKVQSLEASMNSFGTISHQELES